MVALSNRSLWHCCQWLWCKELCSFQPGIHCNQTRSERESVRLTYFCSNSKSNQSEEILKSKHSSPSPGFDPICEIRRYWIWIPCLVDDVRNQNLVFCRKLFCQSCCCCCCCSWYVFWPRLSDTWCFHEIRQYVTVTVFTVILFPDFSWLQIIVYCVVAIREKTLLSHLMLCFLWIKFYCLGIWIDRWIAITARKRDLYTWDALSIIRLHCSPVKFRLPLEANNLQLWGKHVWSTKLFVRLYFEYIHSQRLWGTKSLRFVRSLFFKEVSKRYFINL